MNSSTNTAAYFYYLTVTTFALAFCAVLLTVLNWPLLAEIPLAICIFVQIIALSRSVFNSWANNGKDILEEVFTKTKEQLLHIERREEEVGMWESKKAS